MVANAPAEDAANFRDTQSFSCARWKFHVSLSVCLFVSLSRVPILRISLEVECRRKCLRCPKFSIPLVKKNAFTCWKCWATIRIDGESFVCVCVCVAVSRDFISTAGETILKKNGMPQSEYNAGEGVMDFTATSDRNNFSEWCLVALQVVPLFQCNAWYFFQVATWCMFAMFVSASPCGWCCTICFGLAGYHLLWGPVTPIENRTNSFSKCQRKILKFLRNKSV